MHLAEGNPGFEPDAALAQDLDECPRPARGPRLCVPKTCATWADALRDAVGSVTQTVPGGQVWIGLARDDLRLVGLKLIFLVVPRTVSVLGLWRREAWWKDAEILMLRHQLAVAMRERPRTHSRLAWPDRAWLALIAGTLPVGRLAGLRLIMTPATILRWHRDIVRRRWARLSGRGRSGRPTVRRMWGVMGTARNRIVHGGDNQPSPAQLAALTRLAHTVAIGAALNLLRVPDTVLCAAIDQGQWPVM